MHRIKRLSPLTLLVVRANLLGMKLLAAVEIKDGVTHKDTFYIPYTSDWVEHDKYMDVVNYIKNKSYDLYLRVYDGSDVWNSMLVGECTFYQAEPHHIFDLVNKVHEFGRIAEEKKLAKVYADG